MFCPRCGSILFPKQDSRKVKLVCSCGFSTTEKEEIKLRESVEKKPKVEVIDQKMETLPKTKINCSKCGNAEAYYWGMQTRAGDEAETRFFECTKCGHRWREY